MSATIEPVQRMLKALPSGPFWPATRCATYSPTTSSQCGAREALMAYSRACTGTLSFAPGQTSATLTVPINGDLTLEPAETVSIDLSNAQGEYLIHPDPRKAFAFDRGQSALVQDEFPAVRELLV